MRPLADYPTESSIGETNVRKPLSASRVALLALGVLSLFGSAAYGQDRDRRDDGRRDEGRRDEVRGDEHPDGIVQDWSHRHLVYPRVGPMHNLIAIQHDQRALFSWQDSWRREWRRGRNPRHFRNPLPTSHTDWSISLGGGTTAQNMFPAKFTFDKNAVPDCTSDFVVFAVDATAGVGQPNLVGFNNLYSGTAGSTGICNAPANGRVAAVGVDDGVSATTLFSYAVKAAGGQISTSPALSLDGTKVAFVETAPATTAHFHVLAWGSGAGVSANLQAPATAPLPVIAFVGTAPVAGTSDTTDLPLGASSDTLSSPFVEYSTDQAYVGSDNGTLYRIINVFCTGISTPCTPGGATPPSLDATWGTAGGLDTGCPGRLTGAVVDGGTGNIFVGCSNGMLYGFTPAGIPLSNSPVVVGDGSATGGIVDTPLIDVTNEYVYAVSGNSGGGTQVVVQASTVDLSNANVATLNPGGLFNLHAPAFNNAYLSGTGTPLLYEMGSSATSGGEFTLFGITFGALNVMNTGTPANVQNFVFKAFELSPMTEFFDGTTDRLFESTIGGGASLAEFDITTTFPAAPVGVPPSEGTGTTGIIVDNAASTTNQADSIYFGVLGSNTAVKLTQSGLQ
jgi:hypothetical protein